VQYAFKYFFHYKNYSLTMYGTVLLVERKVRYGKEIWVVQLLPAMYLFQHFNLWFVAIVETGELVDADAA